MRSTHIPRCSRRSTGRCWRRPSTPATSTRCCQQLSEYLERDIAAKRQVKSALTYPIIVLVVAFVAMIVMSVFVLPKFTGLYSSLGADLPLPTRMLIGFTNFMTAYWLFVLGAMALVVIVAVRRRRRRPGQEPPRLAGDEAAGDRQPLPPHLARAVLPGAVVARRPPACRCRSRSACRPTAPTTRSSRRSMVDGARALVRGGGLYEPMAETGLFPIAARQMIQVGERTGMLGNQLGKAASYYEREVTFTMKKATELFQPASSCSSRSSSVSSPSPRSQRCTASLARSSEAHLESSLKSNTRAARFAAPTQQEET